jgi:hypothetical protein
VSGVGVEMKGRRRKYHIQQRGSEDSALVARLKNCGEKQVKGR